MRPIRFGLIAAAADASELIQTAQAADRSGYSTIALNDHFNSTVAPLVGLQAIAGATPRVRLSTAVLNQDLRHPAVLAKEVATLDAFTGGRVELGLGAGWVRADYEQSGIPFEPAPRRIARLEETIYILEQLFTQGTCTFAGKHFTIAGLENKPASTQPGGPPILVGGGGRRILSMAARRADIIQVLGASFGTDGAVVDDLSSFHRDAFEERLGWIAKAAGNRCDDIELSLMLVFVAITDDAERAAGGFLQFLSSTVARYGGEVGNVDVRLKTLLESPVVAIGTQEEVCAKLRYVRDTLGFSYFVMPYGTKPQDLAPIVEQLTGA